MKKLVKFLTFIVGFRYILKILSENVDVKIQIEKLRNEIANLETCLLYTSPSPRDPKTSRMPSSA